MIEGMSASSGGCELRLFAQYLQGYFIGVIRRIVCISVCSCFAQSAQAASFDCEQANTKVEHLICESQELSKLDDEMVGAYTQALQEKEWTEEVKQGKEQWLEYRNTCQDADCVKSAYDMYLSALTVTHIYGFDSQNASIDARRSGYPFKLIIGGGVEVCEIYRKNLEALSNDNLACERRVSPDYKDLIKFPQWRKLDLWENRNLWARVEKIIHRGVQPESITPEEQYQTDVSARQCQENAERYHREVYKLYEVNMDLDNNGRHESVLRYGSGLCGEPVSYTSIALFVLNEKSNMVDLQRSRPLFQDSGSNRWSDEIQMNGTIGNGSMYDVFFFKDKSFFDRWTWTGVWIYQISNGNTEAICHLK